MFVQVQEHANGGSHLDATVAPLFVATTVHKPRSLLVDVHTPARLVFTCKTTTNKRVWHNKCRHCYWSRVRTHKRFRRRDRYATIVRPLLVPNEKQIKRARSPSETRRFLFHTNSRLRSTARKVAALSGTRPPENRLRRVASSEIVALKSRHGVPRISIVHDRTTTLSDNNFERSFSSGKKMSRSVVGS